MKRYYWWIYFFVAVIISLYSQLEALYFVHFLIGSLVTFLFFVGIYFCLRDILSFKVSKRIVRSICIIILLVLVYLSWVLASASRITSYCRNVVARDIFTGNIEVDCNPPWHTTIIGGEEARQILLEHCLAYPSALLERNPGYCDVYKNAPVNKDWTHGENP